MVCLGLPDLVSPGVCFLGFISRSLLRRKRGSGCCVLLGVRVLCLMRSFLGDLAGGRCLEWGLGFACLVLAALPAWRVRLSLPWFVLGCFSAVFVRTLLSFGQFDIGRLGCFPGRVLGCLSRKLGRGSSRLCKLRFLPYYLTREDFLFLSSSPLLGVCLF